MTALFTSSRPLDTLFRSSLFRFVPALICLAAAMLLVPAGCASPPDPGEVSSPTARRYVVRGQVEQLPTPDNPASELMVHHEAIDDFVGWQGEVSGMDSMTMPFPVSDEEQLKDIAVGDKIHLVLEVDWDSDRPLQVVEIKKIPANSQLEFRAARPPAAD